jgi:hypothetical protein
VPTAEYDALIVGARVAGSSLRAMPRLVDDAVDPMDRFRRGLLKTMFDSAGEG